jgi:tetratricopeptide (TPR) repeat protein
MLTDLPERAVVTETIAQALREARAAGDEAIEGRLLVATALSHWRYDSTDPAALEDGLRSGEEALAIGERMGRPALRSAAMDAIGGMLLTLGRYREARELADRRLVLAVADGRREERMDACSQAAQTRIAIGDYAAAVAAGELGSAPGPEQDAHWQARPVLDMAEAFFYWDQWDEALRAYDRYLALQRRSGGRSGKTAGRASGVAAAVHLLRGEQEQADELEQRLGMEPLVAFQQMVAQALLGRGEPELALDRVRHRHNPGPRTLAVRAEALALLGRWDELDETLAHVNALPGIGELPRVVAQLDRARGIAGDERALDRATAGFAALGCRFEHARCLELAGDVAAARAVYERVGAIPALERVGV